MTTPRLAYIIQLDLPGHPIKIGSSKNPLTRFDSFSSATPVDCRYIGVTLNGIEREREMLAATECKKIKGEWRYETPKLLSLVRGYHEQGEWFEFSPDKYDGEDISRRILAINPNVGQFFDKRPPTRRSCSYAWANGVLWAARTKDPLLGVHWAGFREAQDAPSFIWRDSPMSIAA